jgi:molybdate transport system substrate-binding protein
MLLEQTGRAVKGSRFTYAVGGLVLWSPKPEVFQGSGSDVLAGGRFRALAIANPDLAPYGAAARQALTKLKLWSALKGKIVMGENIGQAYALVATGNAELGLIARAYLLSVGQSAGGISWDVPRNLHTPIRQDAVLLNRAADNPAARDFMNFLKSGKARAVIMRFGYGGARP